MAALTIRLPDDKHTRLKKLAESKGISINELIEELSTIALVEFDTHTRFKAMATQGNPEEGLKLLAKLDALTEGK
jgi:predicted DNA-binding ribbon-helix-helix protein